ncbi:MAG: hypothetical protein JWN99_399, partial [Ilumatobacteraceae bacterium]|nr:hypothetical protein [Ilumatobacteraceae bacterium]
MSGTWPMILIDVVAVVATTTGCFALANRFDGGWQQVLAYQVFAAVALLVLVAVPLRYFLMQQRHEAEVRESILVDEGHRREFDARLSRALDMADSEAAVLSVAER